MARTDDTSAVRTTHAQSVPEGGLTVAPVYLDPRGTLTRYTPPPLPAIRLQGRWLQHAGFTIATRVRVRVMNGCLVITLD
jgi:hypothetical protein